MIRTVALVVFVTLDALFGRIMAEAAGAGPTDPIGILTSLGVGGIVAMPVYLWQRDTAKVRDKALDQLEANTEAIRESTQAQKAVAAAVETTNRLMERRWDRER